MQKIYYIFDDNENQTDYVLSATTLEELMENRELEGLQEIRSAELHIDDESQQPYIKIYRIGKYSKVRIR